MLEVVRAMQEEVVSFCISINLFV